MLRTMGMVLLPTPDSSFFESFRQVYRERTVYSPISLHSINPGINHMLKRREIAFIVAIITGIVVGRLIKKVTVGMLIGLILGVIAAMLMANRGNSNK